MKQKVIKIGSSIGVVIPTEMAKRRGIEAGQAVSLDEKGEGIFITQTGTPNKEISETVARATAYIEKYRKDFEALAD